MLTKQEIIKVQSSLINYQDSATVRLLWEGLNIEEVLNLKIQDVNFGTGELQLENRVLSVSTDVIHLIETAYQEAYYTMDDVIEELEESDYVIAFTKGEKRNKESVAKRVGTVQNETGLELNLI